MFAFLYYNTAKNILQTNVDYEMYFWAGDKREKVNSYLGRMLMDADTDLKFICKEIVIIGIQ